MPGPKPPMVELSEAERLALEQFIRRHLAPQRLVLRCRIVLAAGTGLNNSQIARQLDLDIETAAIWRQRWLNFQAIPLAELSIEERLADLPRPGAPAKFTAEQVCRIVAMACEDPGDSGRPISQWSQREIADEVVKRGIVEHISPRQAGRFLKAGGSPAASSPLLADACAG
ncbi:MAG: helix-turn-helix domain-containing protein [Chloroflexi bacterium]|nr:helix-turn-helix domain-containing protein [Chloroflexota bacterium]